MAEKATPAAAQKPQREKKSNKRLFLILGTTMLLLLVGGVVAWKTSLATKLVGRGREARPVTKAAPGQEKQGEIGQTFSLGTFIVNLNDPSGRRYLKVRAELELSQPEASKQVERMLPQLRDTMILALTSKTYEDISSTEGKVKLRHELLEQLNRDLGNGFLKTVYFTEFVVQ